MQERESTAFEIIDMLEYTTARADRGMYWSDAIESNASIIDQYTISYTESNGPFSTFSVFPPIARPPPFPAQPNGDSSEDMFPIPQP